jgi:hypothetical protein
MDKIKFRFPAFILLTFVLGSINASIVRAAESSSYRLETYGESADVVAGASAGYTMRGSVDWTRKVLMGQNYQIVPDGGSGYSSSRGGGGDGSSTGSEGTTTVVASRGDRAGSFVFDFASAGASEGSTRLPLSGEQRHEPSSEVVREEMPSQHFIPQNDTHPLYRQKVERVASVRPFERSRIIETYTPIAQIPCLTQSTRIGCITVAEATVLSRLSFLYRAEQAISSIPAFQSFGRSAFTSSLLNMRAGSISLEGLFFPFGFLRRKKRKSEKEQKNVV